MRREEGPTLRVVTKLKMKGKRPSRRPILRWLDNSDSHLKGKNTSLNIYTTIVALYAKICSQNLTDFYPHGLNSTPDHRVHFSTPTSCQSATFVRPLFAFVLCFYDKKSSKKHKCDESVSIGVIDQVRSANDDPNALLQVNRYMATQVPALIQPVNPRWAGLLLRTASWFLNQLTGVLEKILELLPGVWWAGGEQLRIFLY